MRCLPLKGTAGLQRLAVSGCRREPSPPAMTKASTFLLTGMNISLIRCSRWNDSVGEDHRSQRWHGDEGTGRPAAQRVGRGFDMPEVADAASPVKGGIAVQDFMPG